ncbi:MAG: DUF1570 domain-containing protein [Planctomycetia bacterium]|nr:DUF1570 domain-containing protein [Planctomycetia bacterium]
MIPVRILCILAVPALATAIAGCAHLASHPGLPAGMAATLVAVGGDSGLPARSEVTAGQLVIHADFPIAGQHRLVRELDSLRTDVSQELALPISDEPVHLYLFESTSRYDAFVARQYPTFPARRAFFVETDTTLSVFAVWQDRVAEDLRHETTHGYVHAVVPAVPLWLDEGIAEFFETPRGEQGLHRGHVAHLAGRLLEGTWRPDMDRLDAVTSPGEMSQDHYAEAWCWVHWLLRSTPERRELLQNYLLDVRRDPDTPPLSARLRHELRPSIDAAAEVKAHLSRLAAAASTER